MSGVAGVDSDQVSHICGVSGHWTAVVFPDVLHDAAVAEHKPVSTHVYKRCT